MPQDQVTQEEWVEWRDHPVTVRVLNQISQLCLEVERMGCLDQQSMERTALTYSHQRGYLAGLNTLLNWRVEEESE